MSLAAITWAWSLETNNPTQKLVLMALCDHVDEQGLCWPSVKLIAERSGCQRRTVQRHLRDLEQDGFIEAIPHYRDDGSQTSNRYRVNMSRGGDNVTRGGVMGDTGGASPVSPHEPSVEPSDKKQHTVDPWPTVPPKKNGQYQYPPPFEKAWSEYPSRDGSNPKTGGYKAFRARVKSGDDPEDLIRSATHYRQDCDRREQTGTPYVQQASTFWGPSEPWREFIQPVSRNGNSSGHWAAKL